MPFSPLFSTPFVHQFSRPFKLTYLPYTDTALSLRIERNTLITKYTLYYQQKPNYL